MFKGEPFTLSYSEILLNHFAGFVYQIKNLDNYRLYIGKKHFCSFRKGKKHESTWANYFGSSVSLTNDIMALGAPYFSREILSIHQTEQLVSYNEVRTMFLMDVLEAKCEDGVTPLFYNDHIPSIAFKRLRA